MVPAPAPSLNYRVKIKTKQFTLYSSDIQISKSSIQFAINMFTKYYKCFNNKQRIKKNIDKNDNKEKKGTKGK